jgi:hypothetical protein
MQQFLFVVEVPPLPSGTVGTGVAPEWSAFSSAASSTLKTVKSPTQLQPNAWLLPAENSLPALSALCALATKCRLSYSAVLIPDGATIIAKDVKPSP